MGGEADGGVRVNHSIHIHGHTRATLLQCPECRYSLLGSPLSEQCPECGFRLSDTTRVWINHRYWRRHLWISLAASLGLIPAIAEVATGYWVLLSEQRKLVVNSFFFLGVVSIGVIVFSSYRLLQIVRHGVYVTTDDVGIRVRAGVWKREILWEDVLRVSRNSLGVIIFQMDGRKCSIIGQALDRTDTAAFIAEAEKWLDKGQVAK